MFPLLNCCLFLVPQDVIWSCCGIPTLSNTCIIITLLFCFSFLLYFQSHPSTEFSQKGQLNDAHRTLLRATVAVFVNYFTSQCIYYMLACTFRLFCNFMFYLLFLPNHLWPQTFVKLQSPTWGVLHSINERLSNGVHVRFEPALQPKYSQFPLQLVLTLLWACIHMQA